MDYRKFILRDPKVCGGEPVIKGSRVTIRTILASLAEGARIEEILRDFPVLTEEQVMAVIAFAADSAEEDLPLPGMLFRFIDWVRVLPEELETDFAFLYF